MKYNRTKNATRNMLFTLIMRIYNLVVPFIIRTMFIYIMGAKYLGLNSLFSSILSVLSLAELGVGSAMVYSMYKPLAEDDTETVCALMRLYKIYYRVIGTVVLLLGLGIAPFLPYIIKDDIPADVNLYVLYFLHLATSVLSYWLFAYKNSIIGANQRDDVHTKISLVTTTLSYVLQIVILLVFHNYYLYVSVGIATGILNNIITARIADRMFPQFRPRGKLPKARVQAINQRVRDLFTSKLGTVIVYSLDTVVISAFLGLTELAKYQNYYYIMTSVVGFVSILYSSMTSIIGNSIVAESREKNYRDFRILLFIVAWIAGVCAACFLCLYQPFMELWVGKDLMLEFGIVICFCIYFFVCEINKILNLYKDASGMWHSDRFRPLIISLLNLSLNLASVRYFGLYGIILSTVLPIIFVGFPWLVHNLSHEIFEPGKMKGIFARIVWYCAMTAVVAGITFGLCSFLNFSPLVTFLSRAVICAIVPNVLFLLIYGKMGDFRDTYQFVDARFLKGRMPWLKKLLG